MNTIISGKYFRFALFALTILGLSYIYNYHETIQYRPTSIHQWRNSVSASIAWNYGHEGEFFHPRTHNMQVDNFTSDITITEFPLVYYFVGMLYRIFGYHEWIFKLLQILIGYTGLYCLYLMGLRTFKNTMYALFLPVMIFTSPIYIYYLNNFIPDAVSLSLVFIGLYYFYRFYEQPAKSYFLLAVLFLVFAGSLKTPALLIFLALSAVFLLENVFRMRFKSEDRIFVYPGMHIAVAGSLFLLLIAWYIYAKVYTDIHGGIVSVVEIRPIWILDQSTIAATWDAVKERFWAGHYHSPVLLWLTLALWIHNLVKWKQYNRLLSWMTLLSIFGGICFSILFYRSMRNHDYYQMNNLVLLVLISMNFLDYIKRHHAKAFQSWITKSAFALLAIFLVLSARNLIHTHYYNGWFEKNARERYNNMYNDITPKLRSLGIDRTDKVYCTPDPSINISLYLMDQNGFTDFYRNKYPFSEKLELFRKHGLQYVIIGDMETLDITPEEGGLMKIGEHNGARIYAIGSSAEK